MFVDLIDVKLEDSTYAYIGRTDEEDILKTFQKELKRNVNILENFINRNFENLSDDEKDIVRRGRNAENHHLPKNSNVQEYMHATAFEALIGYLYLTKRYKRLEEILKLVL